MVKKRYYFPHVEKGTPFYHYTLTSKTLMEKLRDVDDALERITKYSKSQSPKYILYLMLQHNESLLELSEFASAPESASTSPAVKSSPESSIPEKNPSVSSLKRRRLSFDDSTKSRSLDTGSSRQTVFDSPPKKGMSTISKTTELVLSPEKRSPRASSLKRKHSSFGDSAKSKTLDTGSSSSHQTVCDSPPQKGSATISKTTDPVPASKNEPRESASKDTSGVSTTAKRLLSPIKKPERDIYPTTGVQESVSQGGKAEMAKKPDSGSPAHEFKIPALPVRAEEEISKPAKRPHTSGLSPIIRFPSPSKKAKILEDSTEDDEMDISPSKLSPSKRPTILRLSPIPEFVSPSKKANISPSKSSPAKRPTILSLSPRPEFVSPSKKNKTPIQSPKDDKIYKSPNKGGEARASPRKDCNVTAASQDKIESTTQTSPIVKDYGFGIDIPSTSEEMPGPSYKLTAAEMEKLVDDLLRANSITDAVEERMKVCISPKKTKEDSIPSEKKCSNRSPRKPRKIGSPGKDIKSTSLSEPENICASILSHPNVMAYLKMKFKSILLNRNNYMSQIFNYFRQFYSDVSFLYFYSTCVFYMVRDIPVEGEVYFTREVRHLKNQLLRDATVLRNHLRPLTDTGKVDLAFWAESLNEVHRLNEKNDHFLLAESRTQTTVEFLREYESKLRIIWKRMDSRVLVADEMRMSVLEIEMDFIRLTKDFGRFLVAIKLMKPSSIASSEGDKRRMRVSWH